MPAPENIPPQNPYGPLVTFKSTDILPPSAIYVSPQDQIRLNIVNPTVAVTVNVTYRLLRADGQLITSAQQFVSPPGGVNETIPPSEGFLISMEINADSTSRGQCFVKGWLAPSSGLGGFTIAHMFMQGYVSSTDQLCFPQSPTESSLNGRGWLRDVSAGGGLGIVPTIAVPVGVHWIIRAALYGLTTDGVAGNRFAGLAIIDPTATRTFTQWAPAAIIAGQIQVLNFSAGATATSNTIEQTAGFSRDLVVPAGWSIAGRVFNMDAGDQTGALVLTVEEFVGQ